MNIIFVDIDGPLMSRKMHMFHENRTIGVATSTKNPPRFDEFAIKSFNLWAKYGNAKIVLSTAWAWNFSTEELKEFMKCNGLGFDYHDVVLTPKHKSSSRGGEITEWLTQNSEVGDKFIAVDDDTSCQDIERYMEDGADIKAEGEWINVDFDNGLSWDNFLDGCTVLGIDIDDIYQDEFGIAKLTEKELAARHTFEWPSTF